MGKKEAHERLLEVFKYLRSIGCVHTQSDFATAIGVRIGHLNNAINGDEKRLTKGLFEKIAKAFSEYVDETWLLSGDGKMEKLNPKTQRIHIPSEITAVSAGFMGTSIASVTEGECELRPVISPFPWYDFTIEVIGDSMSPTLLSGDVIAGEWLGRGDTFDPDKLYILDTNDGAVVKRITLTEEGLLCHSDNPAYKDFIVDSSTPMRVARVVGMIRRY